MSDSADARDGLEKVADLAPFTERELTIIRAMPFDSEGCIREDLESDPEWTGEKALAMLQLMDGEIAELPLGLSGAPKDADDDELDDDSDDEEDEG